MGRRMVRDESGMTLVEMLTVIAILSISFSAIYGMMQMNTRVLERESKSVEARSGAFDQLNELLRDAQKARRADIRNLTAPNRVQLTLHNELFRPNGIKTYLLTDADGDGRDYALSVDGREVLGLRVNAVDGRPFFSMNGDNTLTVVMSYREASANGAETVLETSIASRVYGPLARMEGLTLSGLQKNIQFTPSIFFYSATGRAGATLSVNGEFDDKTYKTTAVVTTPTVKGPEVELADGVAKSVATLAAGENKLVITMSPDLPAEEMKDEDKVNYEIVIYGE
ncbi:prepilin-type N-terminal cleavage/methylation domain-containing protein [Heliobacterium gestii]|uniref:Prepilin-type N-terminal cleavage/methylation domain-containing protein n=1 Tax=Heliomicrobium gestii TaxID=2699 RepID=A0A845LEG3_HELGE|nr:type II secretion system protein [Heliomicrobium gestii]MBM7867878.1 prepilin-type N-terminal cleavage/methylation domain-containing protein [Heliomicrobium gestii]MZP43310.1 prepilin-type N-terminal cleavage/methylation domain-containing protein [Heliomicrobium gestii]